MRPKPPGGVGVGHGAPSPCGCAIHKSTRMSALPLLRERVGDVMNTMKDFAARSAPCCVR